MTSEDIITQVLILNKDIYVPCRDVKHCESVRVSVYQTKKRIIKSGAFKSAVDMLAVQRVERDGNLFVRVYKKRSPDLLTEQNGELVTMQVDEDLKRIISVMVKDGQSEEDILTFVKDWKGEK
jgi:hypothetical protein